MVVIGIFLMISDVEHFFMYLLASWITSLEKYLFSSSTHFLMMFCFALLLLLDCMNSSYILDINPLSDMTCNYFLPFYRLPLYLVGCIFCCAEDCFDVFPLIYFYICCLCFWYHIQKIIAKTNYKISLYVLF